MGGAFQTSRDIFNNPIWQDIAKFRIFFFIVGNAVFSNDGVRIADIHIKRGQFLRSYRNLCDDLQYTENRKVKKYSVSVISRKIDCLVKEERLKIESTELGTLFTVVNYDVYQGFEHYKKRELGTVLEQCWNSDGTVLEQSGNNNNKVNKDNKEIKNTTTTTASTKIMEFWDANGFGFANTNAKNKLLMFLDEGFDDDVILRALEIASNNNKVSYSYVEKVLIDWSKRGLKTLKLVQAAEAEREQQKQARPSYSKKPIRQEIVPEHMDKEYVPTVGNQEELDAKKKAMEDKLKQFRK